MTGRLGRGLLLSVLLLSSLVALATVRNYGQVKQAVADALGRGDGTQPMDPALERVGVIGKEGQTVYASASDSQGTLWTWEFRTDASPTGATQEQVLVNHAADGTELRKIPLALPWEGGPHPAGMYGALTVGPSGDLWIGASLKLWRVAGVDGTIKSWDLPDPGINRQLQAAMPQASAPAIASLVFTPNGDALMAIASANAIVRFSPSTETSHLIPLPDIGEGMDADVGSDGTIAVAMGNVTAHAMDTLVLLTPEGKEKKTIGGIDSGVVTAVGNDFFTGTSRLYKSTSDGVVSTVEFPKDLILDTKRIHPRALSDRKLAVAGTGFVAVLDKQDLGHRRVFLLGSDMCVPNSFVGGGRLRDEQPQSATSTTAAPRPCPRRADELVASRGELLARQGNGLIRLPRERM